MVRNLRRNSPFNQRARERTQHNIPANKISIRRDGIVDVGRGGVGVSDKAEIDKVFHIEFGMW